MRLNINTWKRCLCIAVESSKCGKSASKVGRLASVLLSEFAMFCFFLLLVLSMLIGCLNFFGLGVSVMEHVNFTDPSTRLICFVLESLLPFYIYIYIYIYIYDILRTVHRDIIL